jgi:hypothetical protein
VSTHFVSPFVAVQINKHPASRCSNSSSPRGRCLLIDVLFPPCSIMHHRNSSKTDALKKWSYAAWHFECQSSKLQWRVFVLSNIDWHELWTLYPLLRNSSELPSSSCKPITLNSSSLAWRQDVEWQTQQARTKLIFFLIFFQTCTIAGKCKLNLLK